MNAVPSSWADDWPRITIEWPEIGRVSDNGISTRPVHSKTPLCYLQESVDSDRTEITHDEFKRIAAEWEAAAEANEWSVLRPNLLRAGAELVFGHSPTALEMSSLRVLFNTWQNSGVLSVAKDAQSEVWKRREAPRSESPEKGPPE